ncbi:uncharacterized protein METZ01_LOCUS405560 [marine metagenome]|uniref:Uncharacterized protein n=1 Tax=marine metagenome TaxID=408172 RepID=A0A382W1I8_9ZZZZ
MKSNGVIAVTELSWTKDDFPKEISEFWESEYFEMQSIEENIKTANECGYHLEAHLTLTESDWFDNYYIPMKHRINQLKVKYKDSEETLRVLNNELKEIMMYKKYSAYYGYEFFILRPSFGVI